MLTATEIDANVVKFKQEHGLKSTVIDKQEHGLNSTVIDNQERLPDGVGANKVVLASKTQNSMIVNMKNQLTMEQQKSKANEDLEFLMRLMKLSDMVPTSASA